MNVPPEAVRAATDALLAYWGNPEWGADEVRGPITKVLEAAAPLIRAAERERIAKLAEQRGAICSRLPDRPLLAITTSTVTILDEGSLPPVISFAGVIRKEEPT